MSDHTVTITYDQGVASEKFTCRASEDALCHATHYCKCRQWPNEEMVDGRPQHDGPDGEPCVGTMDVKDCDIRTWFNASQDALTGSVTVPVEAVWEGEDYSITLAPKAGA